MMGVSVTNAAVSSSRPPVSSIREEVEFPLLRQQQEKQKRQKMREALPKYYLPKLDTQPQTTITMTDGEIRNLKHRSNVALARSHESRPVFGQVPPLNESSGKRKVERFFLDNKETSESNKNRPPPATAWTTWLAGFALFCMLVETGYKEYRRCRIDMSLEAERRL
jgi:hypothetical protein